MKNIITNFEKELKKQLKTAEQVYIAVGLISVDGANMLVDAVNRNDNLIESDDNVQLIVGINMPTPAEALKILVGEDSGIGLLKYYAKPKSYFHPKVYLFKKKDRYTAFVGSANYTDAGLGRNVELTARVTNQIDCKDILNWFRRLLKDSKDVSMGMIKRYEKIKRKTAVASFNVDKFQNDEAKFEITDLKKDLLKCCKSKQYEDFCKKRENEIENLCKIVDAENQFENFDVAAFCNEGALGHIIAYNIDKLKRSKKKLQKMCRMLADERRSVSNRINLALTDRKYKVNGAGINVVSKILTILHPEKYFVWNKVSKRVSNALGAKVLRGSSIGEKYQAYCNAYKPIMEKYGIENFAILDRILYYIETRK